jgi:hypothetical protein
MPSPAAPASLSTAIYWLVVLILAAIGYWLQSWPKAEIEARRRLPGWRKTSGTVTASRLDETPHASLSIPGRLLKLKADLYKPVISYSYSVGERAYQCSRYKNSFLSRGEEWQAVDRAVAAEIVAAHPPGTSVTVTYDPDDPTSAYLELDASISRLFVFRTSGVVLLLAAALMFARSAYSSSGNLLAGRTQPETAAVFPVPGPDIRAGITTGLGLTCQYDGIYHETYESWLCQDPSGVSPSVVYVYCRKLALAKTDLLSAQASPPDAPAFFAALLPVAMPLADAQALQAWVVQWAPTLAQSGGKAQMTLNDVPFVLFSPSKNILQLDIGEYRE